MKPCLADASFLLPLLVERHKHHIAATHWWREQEAGRIGLCRLTQLAVVRLLSSQAVMEGEAIPAKSAWEMTMELLADERVEFWPEPLGLDDWIPRQFRFNRPTRSLISDAYLAGFALCRGSALVTFDSGFRQFEGLQLELLNAGK